MELSIDFLFFVDEIRLFGEGWSSCKAGDSGNIGAIGAIAPCLESWSGLVPQCLRTGVAFSVEALN